MEEPHKCFPETEEFYMCIDGIVFGPCEYPTCGGVCVYAYECNCHCHEEKN